jgi:hypothetical protein
MEAGIAVRIVMDRVIMVVGMVTIGVVDMVTTEGTTEVMAGIMAGTTEVIPGITGVILLTGAAVYI